MTETRPIDFAPRLKRLGSETLVYGLSSIVGRLLSYLLQPYYAHQFDPAQNGVQSVVYSYIPIISIALYLGMDIAYMRNAASVKDAPLVERQRVFTMSFGVVAVVGGVLAMLAVMATPWLAALTRLDPVSFRYMMAIVYTDALLAVPFAHLRMSNQSLRYAILRVLFVGISIALNIVLDRPAALGRVRDLFRQPRGEPVPPRDLPRGHLAAGPSCVTARRSMAAALGVCTSGDAGDARGDAGRERRPHHA